MLSRIKQFKVYFFPLILLLSIIAGGVTSYLLGPKAIILKPLGDVFLNLLFCAIVPLIFFSVSSCIARTSENKKLWKTIVNMMMTFMFTGIFAGVFMIVIVKIFPPAQGVFLNLSMPPTIEVMSLSEQLVHIFTVSDFTQLFSHQHILPLICFSILVGLATSLIGEKSRSFSQLLDSGTEISLRVISLIMYFAPIGFFAYFAQLVAEFGPKLFETYVRVTLIYYCAAFTYFAFAFTLYAYAAHKDGIKIFWLNAVLPMITSVATCSSIASIPANLQATQKMGIAPNIYATVVPMGAVLHKDGSVLGGILKIAFLFGIFHMNFAGPLVLLTALCVALLVGTVMGAIPSGGMLGEILILSVYGFPPQALLMIAVISIIIDPLSTMLNVTGDSVCSMLVARLVEGDDWVINKNTG